VRPPLLDGVAVLAGILSFIVRVYLSVAVIIASKVGPDRAGKGPSFSGLGSDP